VETLTHGSGDTYLVVVPIEVWRAGMCLAEGQGRLMQVSVSKLLHVFWTTQTHQTALQSIPTERGGGPAPIANGKCPLNEYLKTTHLLPNSAREGTGNS
jgi:hypothetical protein